MRIDIKIELDVISSSDKINRVTLGYWIAFDRHMGIRYNWWLVLCASRQKSIRI